jgi:hypothetical protein
VDAKRFDRLVNDINRIGSRRGALRLLGGGALAGALALLGREETAARCRPRSRKCGQGVCCPMGEICGDRATQTCVTGKGTCRTGANVCENSAKTCNDNELCGCLPAKEGGKTRCVSLILLAGCCATDAQCVISNPGFPGAVCIDVGACTSIDCRTNPPPVNGRCYAPCSQPEPE